MEILIGVLILFFLIEMGYNMFLYFDFIRFRSSLKPGVMLVNTTYPTDQYPSLNGFDRIALVYELGDIWVAEYENGSYTAFPTYTLYMSNWKVVI